MSSGSNNISSGTALIPNGYYMVPRKRPEIQGAPPVPREVYDYLNAQANYEDRESSGRIISRGQCVRTYEDIQEGLIWYVGFRKMKYSKDQIEGALKWLEKHKLITKTKTTRGLIVTIEKYDFYQTPGNYENHSEDHKKTTANPQPADTINNELKKEKKITLLSLSTKRLPDFFYKDILSLSLKEKINSMECLRNEFGLQCRKISRHARYPEKVHGEKIRELFAKRDMTFAHIISIMNYYFDCYELSDHFIQYSDIWSSATIGDYLEDWSRVKHLYNNSKIPDTKDAWWRNL